MKNVQRLYPIAHRWFEIGIFVKGINGLLEIGGGIFLFFVRPETVRHIITVVTFHELSEDPNDIVANYLMNIARNFSIHTKFFGTIYLLSHGLIKIFLVVSLWKRKLWAYPSAMIVFSLFIMYQMYRYTVSHSVELIILTILDIIIIILTWLEFKRLKSSDFTLGQA